MRIGTVTEHKDIFKNSVPSLYINNKVYIKIMK